MERADQILPLYLSPDSEMSAEVWAVRLDRAQQSGPGAIQDDILIHQPAGDHFPWRDFV
nr:hypothetical protein [Streptomyces europaeiscabiei]MDX2768412.1 hypothetical protein [Streptomyces europaeiscabiei]